MRRSVLLFALIVLVVAAPRSAPVVTAAPSDKAAVCHKPGMPSEKTNSVPEAALSGHLGHGDLLGECGIADIIFRNGQVVTMEPALPQAEALATRGVDILAIGSDEAIMALYGLQTQIIDLDGKALLPGFVDPHQHVLRRVWSGTRPDLFPTYDAAQQWMLAGGETTIASHGIPQPPLEHFLAFARQDGNYAFERACTGATTAPVECYGFRRSGIRVFPGPRYW